MYFCMSYSSSEDVLRLIQSKMSLVEVRSSLTIGLKLDHIQSQKKRLVGRSTMFFDQRHFALGPSDIRH